MAIPALTESQGAQFDLLSTQLRPLTAEERAAELQRLATEGQVAPVVLSVVAWYLGHLPDPGPDWTGMRLGNYTLEAKLGAGGMGVVYRAQQHIGSTTRTVAMKLIHPTWLQTAGQEAQTRFEAEIGTLAKLEHEGIARIYDGGIVHAPQTHAPLLFIAMEFVRGGLGLTDFCTVHALPVPERLELFLSVCRAIQYAHEHRVIHRDLNTANILVNNAGRPFVIDFGLAQAYDALRPDGYRTISGAPASLSPEQVSDAFGTLSEKTDVYALGLILYELLTGQRPYELPRDGTVAAWRQVITEAVAPPLRQYEAGYAGELEAIVAAALAKHPTDRPTVAVLRSRLERYRQHLLRPEPVQTSEAPSPSRASHRAHAFRPKLWWLIPVILIAGAVFYVTRTHISGLPTQVSDGEQGAEKRAPEEREAARFRLSQLGYQYTQHDFLKSAQQGDRVAVELFLKAGMTPDATNRDDKTALIYAVEQRDTALVEILLQAMAQGHPPGVHRPMGLWVAVCQRDTTILNRLLTYIQRYRESYDAEINSGFVNAANCARFATMRTLLEEPYQANLQKVGPKALHSTVGGWEFRGQERTESIQLLLDKGISPNTPDSSGVPLVLRAIDHWQERSLPIVRTLLVGGANPNARCECSLLAYMHEQTALEYLLIPSSKARVAKTAEGKELVELLKANGARWPARAWLGIKQIKRSSEPQGLVVQQVEAASPADQAAIQPGDIIVRFDGQDVPDGATLQKFVRNKGITTVDVEVLRVGKPLLISVTMEQEPEPKAPE